MDRDTLDSLDKETLIRLILSQAEAIERLTKEVEALRADNAELRAKLDLPPKTPENSSTPPSQGQKARARRARRTRENSASRTLGRTARFIPNPTAKRDVFAAPASIAALSFWIRRSSSARPMTISKSRRSYPHVRAYSLLGGACLCCAKKFKAEPPQDMPKGSPFGPNLRALVIYLRFTQGIAFERLATLLSDLLGLTSARARSSTSSTRRGPFHGGDCGDPREAPRRNDPAIRRDRPAGRQAELVAVGLPS